ncbi:MAG: pirin-like C-terminal cupin domain-containing protein [Candidatus Pseudobacter hemicellulosilyticus]|uniref:Pirin-like C-terminal cupin domain-containing protein n=1 Tax=Candidatus Pseudobacter hemicellulosilyticus TaxID=3121375 RepID=A0AAJ5WZE5_9BACT|nr:MAG: pirin-like C-terminal cupin domain-containing protein [Pseudobacter sp.]
MQKAIQHILAGREKQITKEETVLQSLPHKDFRFANPFIVIHHQKPEMIQPGSVHRIHPHPHRGFSPVTFMVQGEGYHKDNAGHDEIVQAGDSQWMFAGKGLLHSEGPTDAILQKGGIQELVQIWVNVPKANKWEVPYYQMARKQEMPEVLQQEGVHLRLVSGEYDGKTGPLKRSFTPVVSVIGEITAGKEVTFSATPGYWTLLYIIQGSVTINGATTVAEHNLVVFEKENDEFTVVTTEDSKVLLLTAEPIDEPVAAKDNFVMNTAEEVDQAIADYENGVFGTLSY